MIPTLNQYYPNTTSTLHQSSNKIILILYRHYTDTILTSTDNIILMVDYCFLWCPFEMIFFISYNCSRSTQWYMYIDKLYFRHSTTSSDVYRHSTKSFSILYRLCRYYTDTLSTLPQNSINITPNSDDTTPTLYQRSIYIILTLYRY